MFSNYFKLAYRHLLRNKTFSLINIIGLTAGTLCCLYILLYVKDQFSYDNHHERANDIYRITSQLSVQGDKGHNMATASPPIAPAMKNDFSEIEQFTRVCSPPGVSHHLLHYKEKAIYETKAIYVDSTFFEIFNYHFIYGSAQIAVREPYTTVLTLQTAEKLFGKSDPVGKVIDIDNAFGKNSFKITGVVDGLYGKSHILANLFVAMNSGGIGEYVRTNNSWAGNNFIRAYIKLKPNTIAAKLEKKLPAFLENHGAQQLKESGMKKILHLQPISQIHTTSGYDAEPEPTVSTGFLYLLLFIAGMIQMIACINFMNLSTARSANRAKEVGVRKVSGAYRSDLIRQFLGESLMLSILAILLAVPLLWLFLPYLNQLASADIALFFFKQSSIWVAVISLVAITGLLAGSYPAFYLSAFNVIKVLKGNLASNISALAVRKGLVVFQFALSVILIMVIIIIHDQLRYIDNKDLGFEKDQRIIVTFRTDEAKDQMNAFTRSAEQIPGVVSTSKSNNYPSQFIFNDMRMYLQGGSINTAKSVRFMRSDKDFVKATGLHIKAGRDFTATDSGRVIVNEAMLNALGLNPGNAPGTLLYSTVGDTDKKQVSFEIAGVVQDFNFNSLREAISPFMLVFVNREDNLTNLIIATSTKDYGRLIGGLEKSWKAYIPSVPFEYTFLDDAVQQQYKKEITLSRIINAFTLIAIIISCLGLFGLSAFTAEQRIKEIGIRKVLGASISGITTLLSKDFIKLVIIAILIATPVAWLVMDKWLEGFVYRINIEWWVFVLAALAAILIAIVTISFQAIRAAVANPVKSLRSE